jgi:hypothetical protein
MKKPTKSSKKTSRKKQQIIVLMDGAKNYYALPRKVLERCRVSKEHKKEIIEALEDEDCFTTWIKRATIPGSIAKGFPPFKGGRALHYAGFYISPRQFKR